ncbi:wax ester/triacylglycerol synthase family O-acyltransferase [Mycobacterium sp.]|uniref:wax ester/triacylglycerol synthase family O-acyltransferase n=1 Tax=Mycobacterium sp. TaxID=1785 RepID=UPI003F9493B1
MAKPIPPLDLSWLLMESPAGTTHVGAMMLFKKPTGRRRIVDEIVEAYRACPPAPPFNYVPELLGRGLPHFREVASWDPNHHIGHLSLPARATYDDLLRLVAELHEPQLDRDRPMFRCWVIDGVPDSRFAIYTKTHHSIIDGESGLKRIYAGLSTRDEPTVPTPGFGLTMPEPAPHPPTPFAQRIADSVRGALTQVEALNQISWGALRKVLAGLAKSHLEGNLPFVAPHAPTNAPLKVGRSFATLTLPLSEMREIGHQFGATLNDVASAVIDGGLHAYLRGGGFTYGHPLIAMCPVSLRGDDDTAIGTRVSALFVRLGEPAASMPERIRQVVDSVAAAKKELAGMSSDTAMTYAVALIALAGLGASTHLDRVTHPACNLVISNVAGAKETRYLNGARLLGLYPISALAASIGLNATLASYHDSMDFGFVANTSALDDPPRLARCTLQAYEELREAAGLQSAGDKGDSSHHADVS